MQPHQVKEVVKKVKEAKEFKEGKEWKEGKEGKEWKEGKEDKEGVIQHTCKQACVCRNQAITIAQKISYAHL
jgi:hypothetical protein